MPGSPPREFKLLCGRSVALNDAYPHMEFHKGQGIAHPSTHKAILTPSFCAGATSVSPCVVVGDAYPDRPRDTLDELDSPSNVSELCNRKEKHWLKVLVATSHSH